MNTKELIKEDLTELSYESPEEYTCPDKTNISYPVEPDWYRSCETEAMARLSFKDGMWQALVNVTYLEGYSQGEQVFLDSIHGPHSLNESACEMILRVYNVPKHKIKLSDVSTTSPSELERLSIVPRVKFLKGL